MDEIHFFEYAIQLKKCEFIQYEAVGIKVRDGAYRTKFYKNQKHTGNERIIFLNDFEKIQSYRIISFQDDSKYYNQLLLNEYENMIHKSKDSKTRSIFTKSKKSHVVCWFVYWSDFLYNKNNKNWYW